MLQLPKFFFASLSLCVCVLFVVLRFVWVTISLFWFADCKRCWPSPRATRKRKYRFRIYLRWQGKCWNGGRTTWASHAGTTNIFKKKQQQKQGEIYNMFRGVVLLSFNVTFVVPRMLRNNAAPFLSYKLLYVYLKRFNVFGCKNRNFVKECIRFCCVRTCFREVNRE